ncbi:MAG: hypothetical protein ACOC3G_08750 [Phycisphaeraceae bacterium]
MSEMRTDLHDQPAAARRKPAPRRGLVAIGLALSALLILPAIAAAQDLDARPDDGDRWVDPVFGLSLVPPENADVQTRPGDRELVRFTAATGEQIVVKIKPNQYKLTLPELFKRMRGELLAAVLNLIEVDDGDAGRQIDGREAVVRYYVLDKKKGPDDALAIALVPLDDERFLDIRGTGTARDYDRLRELFERTLATLRTPDLRKLYRQRAIWLRRGDAMIDGVHALKLLEQFKGERWYRIVSDGNDVGFERLRIDRSREMAAEGVRVRVDQTLRGRTSRRDRTSAYFVSLDRREAFWSTRVTRRFGQAVQGTPGGKTQSWSETGLRGPTQVSEELTINRINATRELPTGEIQRETWPTPGNAYATVAERRLLIAHRARQLARGEAAEKLAFYAYDEDSFAVTLQTVEPVPRQDDRIEFRVRSSPVQPVERWVFDATGELLERHAAGVTHRQSSRGELTAIWHDSRGLP